MISWNNLKPYGETFHTKKSTIFFGNEYFQDTEIERLIPKNHILWQVHSNIVIPAPKGMPQADGHFTDQKKRALIIKTADCMPVFLEVGEQIFGIHIGWKSLAKKILSQCFPHIKNKKNVKLWVGPHIQQSHYWLNSASINELFKKQRMSISQAKKLGILIPSYEKRGQFLISLKDLLLDEAHSLGIQDFYCSDTNTYSSHKHFSHRRNPYRVGTNYSFIIKN